MINSRHRSGDGLDSIKISYGRRYGDIERIGFKFMRHLIFVHKGAGRGMGGSKGSSWVTSSGQRKKTNQRSLGKMNRGNRLAKRWLSPVLDREVPKLADEVMRANLNAVVNAIEI